VPTTLVKNKLGAAVQMPAPYTGTLPAGGWAVVPDSAANVILKLGGAALIGAALEILELSETTPAATDLSAAAQLVVFLPRADLVGVPGLTGPTGAAGQAGPQGLVGPAGPTVSAGAGLTTPIGGTLAVLPSADGSIVADGAGVAVGRLATDAQHGQRGGGTQHLLATASVDGFMSAADKAKLNRVVLTSPNGTQWQITVDNLGILSTSVVVVT